MVFLENRCAFEVPVIELGGSEGRGSHCQPTYFDQRNWFLLIGRRPVDQMKFFMRFLISTQWLKGRARTICTGIGRELRTCLATTTLLAKGKEVVLPAKTMQNSFKRRRTKCVFSFFFDFRCALTFVV